jgi:ribonuclease P protein component
MLKKELRIDRKGLNSFFKQKTGFTAGNLVSLRYIKNDLGKNRFAVVISFSGGQAKKGRAVIRNLVKRRILEILRLTTFGSRYGLDMVFFVKINSKSAPKFTLLKEDIIYVLHRSRIS